MRRWADVMSVEVRDAVLLVPYAALLPLARRAFLQGAGWSPRIETTQTLAAALGPRAAPAHGEMAFDTPLDRLAGAELLRSRPWGAAWERRDAHGFERAVEDLVATAQAMARAAAACPPAARAAHWAAARERLVPSPGPGGRERLVARVALEWAALAPTPSTDRLHHFRPAAWIAVQAGGADPLTTSLLRAASAHGPCLVIDTDADFAPPAGPGSPEEAAWVARLQAAEPPALAVCDGFEAEAHVAAAQVLHHVARGEGPVALIAQDRLLVRRIRALLERQGAVIHDETGWTLSTTRAAASVVTLLDAAGADASTDQVLDWLTSGSGWAHHAADRRRIDALEAVCRRHGVWRGAAIGDAPLDERTAAWWAEAAGVLRAFAHPSRRSLAGWLDALGAALSACRAHERLALDDAGRQVLAALRLDRTVAGDVWRDAAAGASFTLGEFSRWVRRVFESAEFLPRPPGGSPLAAPQVVITPLAQAMLRPFGAVVFPGADAAHLGKGAAPHRLLADADAAALGLPTAAARRERERLAFTQVLALPRLTFTRRRFEAAEPLAPSHLLERLALALDRAGLSLRPWTDPRVQRVLPRTPVAAGAPSAAALLPKRLSASAVESLRACPYRFYALRMLGLKEPEELDGEVRKREFGNWLHAVLHAFHLERDAPRPAEIDIAALHRHAARLMDEKGLDRARFLPYAASFEQFAPRYAAWLHARDRVGMRWLAGEAPRARPTRVGIELHGIIDRIDQRPDGALELIDYKTGSRDDLLEKMKTPQEDTQLAFYAALVADDGPLTAAYLPLDERDGIKGVEHPGVGRSAERLIDELERDLAQLQAGAALPPLGNGKACEYCAARGVCRRDHWSAAQPA